jgi:hypothetical protein
MDLHRLIAHVDRWLTSTPSVTAKWEEISNNTRTSALIEVKAKALSQIFNAGFAVEKSSTGGWVTILKFENGSLYRAIDTESWAEGAFPLLPPKNYRKAPVGLRKQFIQTLFAQNLDHDVIYFQMTPRIGWCLVTDVAEPWLEDRMELAQSILFDKQANY